MEKTRKCMSPWAEVDTTNIVKMAPYPETPSGKTVGMLFHFKIHSPVMLQEVEKELLRRIPDVKFKHLQYKKTRKKSVRMKNLTRFSSNG